MGFSWFLALRHIFYRRWQSTATVLGVAGGVAAITIALSLTNGFTDQLIRATLKATPHIVLVAYDGREAPPPNDPEITAKTPFLPVKVLLTRRAGAGRKAGIDFATLIGVGQGAPAVYPGLNLEALAPGKVILGSALAAALGAVPGDTLYALTVGQKRRSLSLAAQFETGNYVIDAGYAFITLEDAQALLGAEGTVAGWHLRIKDPARAREVARRLVEKGPYWAQTWQDLNRTLLEQLALQKRVIGLVLSLILGVAALGIANVLALVVREKRADIALLRVLGASSPQVYAAFALEGLILGAVGIILGNLLGLLVALYLQSHPIAIPGELYFITELPVALEGRDFLNASGVALVAVLLASVFPLLRPLRLKPAEALRD